MSRTDLGQVYGYDFLDQLDKIEEERNQLKARGLPEVGLTPFSSPELQNNGNNNQNNDQNNNQNNDKNKQ